MLNTAAAGAQIVNVAQFPLSESTRSRTGNRQTTTVQGDACEGAIGIRVRGMEASAGHQKDFERQLSLLTFVKP